MNPITRISEIIDSHNKSRAKDEQDKFITALADVLTNGNISTYDNYLETLEEVIVEVWASRNEEKSIYTLDTFEDNCMKLVSACADSGNSDSKILCLKLLAFIYETIYDLICKEGIEYRSVKRIRHFEVVNFYNQAKFFNHVFMEVPNSSFFGQFNLSKLLYHMMITDLCLAVEHGGADDTDPFIWGPNSTVLDILRFVGAYVSEQKKRESNHNIISSYWVEQIRFWLDHSFDNDSTEFSFLDVKYRKHLLRAFTSAASMLVCGLIDYGQFDIVHEGLYSNEIRIEDLPKIAEIKRRVIVISRAFLYYMAYRESDSFVEKTIRKSARVFIKDTSGKYLNFINQHDISDILIDELSTDFFTDEEGKRAPVYKEYHIKELIKAFDYRMRNNGFGILILEPVVRDFCLFSILYNNKKCIGEVGFPRNKYGEDGLDWMTDGRHRIDDYISYVQETTPNVSYSSSYTNLDSLGECIEQFITFIDPEEDKPNKMKEEGNENTETTNSIENHKSNIGVSMYESLVNGIKGRYKNAKIRQAFDSDLKYRQIQSKNAIMQYPKIPEWEEEIRRGIAEKFKRNGTDVSFIEDFPYNDDATKGIAYRKDKVLYSLFNFTNMISKSIDKTAVDTCCGALMDNYVVLMINNGMLERYYKFSESYDDHEYIKIISEQGYDMMLGSEFLVRNSDYLLSDSFNQVTKNFAKITGHQAFYGALLKSLGVIFYLGNVHIVVRDADIGDAFSVEQLDDGSYEYEQINGVKIHFTEEELKTYLNQERKVIEVRADVGIKRVGNDRIIGIYIENERIPIVRAKVRAE